MKKFLLLFCLSLFSLVSFANVDTLYFKPGEVIHVPLVVDTVKYDFLEFDDVTWNYDETSIPENQIVTIDGIKYYHLEDGAPNEWDNGTRTMNINYSFSITPTRATGTVIDTVAILHVQKELKDNDIQLKSEDFFYHVGDTIDMIPTLHNGTDTLDINGLALLSIEDKDTTLLAYSEKFDTLTFIPEEKNNFLELYVGAVNKFGTYVSEEPYVVAIAPMLEVTSLQYSTINKEQTVTKTEEGVTEVSFAVLPNDSVRLVVNTNKEEAAIDLTYSWNVDGKGIEADTVIAKKNVLTISKFSKDLAGTYNCIIKDKNLNKVVATVSFKVSYQSPTANEVLTDTNYQVTTENGLVTIKNASNQPILITNMLGKQIFVEKAKSDNFSVPTSESGILIVKVGTEVFKVVNK